MPPKPVENAGTKRSADLLPGEDFLSKHKHRKDDAPGSSSKQFSPTSSMTPKQAFFVSNSGKYMDREFYQKPHTQSEISGFILEGPGFKRQFQKEHGNKDLPIPAFDRFLLQDYPFTKEQFDAAKLKAEDLRSPDFTRKAGIDLWKTVSGRENVHMDLASEIYFRLGKACVLETLATLTREEALEALADFVKENPEAKDYGTGSWVEEEKEKNSLHFDQGERDHGLGDVIIYGLLCKATGKWYVGQSKELEVRSGAHAREPRRLMARDIDEGLDFWEQVELHVLARASTKAAGDRLEALHIESKGSLRPGGYNIIAEGNPARSRQGWAIITALRGRKAGSVGKQGKVGK